MKMEPISSSETSATKNQTPGNHPKKNSLKVYTAFFKEFQGIKRPDSGLVSSFARQSFHDTVFNHLALEMELNSITSFI